MSSAPTKFDSKKVLPIAITFVSLTAPLAFGQLRPPVPEAGGGPPDTGQYIVTFQARTGQADRAASVARAGARLRFNYDIIDAAAVTVPNVNVLGALGRDMSVVSIVPDRAIYALQTPDFSPSKKPGGGGGGGGTTQVTPAGVQRVGAPTGASNGSGIGVVVVDTGIDLDHPDLLVSPTSRDAFGGNCSDGNGHGTHVAGIIAALDNTRDVVGVAPAATLYCGRALDNSGSGTDSTVIDVLNWVYLNRSRATPNMRVVNMSLGRPKGTTEEDAPLRAAIQQLSGAGIAVVVAAGNDPAKEVKDMVPAGFPEVLAVASTTALAGTNSCRWFNGRIAADTASYFTTDGATGVTISAPGEDQENINRACFVASAGILSLKAGGGTTRMSGTSMAAPHVSGVVARLLQGNLATTVDQVRNYLRNHADRANTAPLDSPTTSYSFDGEREGIAQAP